MKAPTEIEIRAMSPDKRATLLRNAQRLGGEMGDATAALILSLHLPLSSGGLSLDHPLYREMEEIAWSAEGKAAALAAVERGLPPMAGVDPLLQKAMGSRYSPEQQGTMNAGWIVGEIMQFMGFEKVGQAPLPDGCVAKTASTFRRKRF